MIVKTTDKTIPFITALEELNSTRHNNSPLWLKQLRGSGLSRFQELGVPTTKDEEWKYTNLTSLLEHRFKIPTTHEIEEPDAFNAYCSAEEINIVFVNGIFLKELSNLKDLPPGVTISNLPDLIRNNDKDLAAFFKKNDFKDSDSFFSLNNAFFYNGVFIRIDPKVIFKPLIHIVHVTCASSTEIISCPRCIIILGKSAEATVLESHVAFSQITYFTNAVTDIVLSEDAKLLYCKAQGESRQAFHIGTTMVEQERYSQLHTFALSTGGLLTRNNLHVSLNGEGAGAILNGLYTVCENQHIDNHTAVDHRVPNCISNQLYKGILNDSSRAVFNGKIFVRKDAQQTNAYQLNKNLLLGKECRVDTKPQLEIFANDVKCTHGATIGQLNEEEIFYLQTRSIPKAAAIKLLARGFVDDILNTIGNDSITPKLNILLSHTFSVLG